MIPKIIHQIWFGKLPVPSETKTWDITNPDWEHKIWRNPLPRYATRAFKLGNGHYNMQADIIRLELLYKYGGVYCDTDMVIFKSINPIFENSKPDIDEFYICYEDEKGHPGLLANTWMACNPGNPTLIYLIRLLNEIKPLHIRQNGDIWAQSTKTGPKFLTDHVQDRLHLFTILSDSLFYPEWCDTKNRNPKSEDYPDSYGFHLWAHSNKLKAHGW